MTKVIRKYFSLFTLIIVGCSSNNFELLNLGTAKKIVQNYYESSQYENDCKKIIDKSIEDINELELPEKATAVFDIDETSLSNYKHIKEIDFGYYYEIWLEWLKKSDAVAIPQTKRFYDYLIAKGVHIVFISGRNYDSYDATVKNLIEQGYTKFDTVIVRSNNERSLPAAEFKASKRNALVSKGYNIVANIGDQLSDFVGGNSGYQIKIPNYLYIID